jgi:hypothetical protein
MEYTNAQIDIIAGICAGISSTIISHPLDTVKVRIQLSKTPLPVRQCFADMYRVEGLRGFWKGVTSPVVARSPISAILFTA